MEAPCVLFPPLPPFRGFTSPRHPPARPLHTAHHALTPLRPVWDFDAPDPAENIAFFQPLAEDPPQVQSISLSKLLALLTRTQGAHSCLSIFALSSLFVASQVSLLPQQQVMT